MGAPAPSPTASPAPTPSPTPTPDTVYETAFDLSRDRGFPLNMAELTAVATSRVAGFSYTGISSRIVNPGDAPALAYVSATQEASVSFSTGGPRRYAGSEISLRASDRLVYTTSDGFLSIGQPGPDLGGFPAALRYTLLTVQSISIDNADFTRTSIERRAVAGTSTRAADVPRSGSASYRVLFAAIAQTALATSSYVAQDATLTIDFVTRTVQGTIIAASARSTPPASAVTLTIAGQLSATSNRISGSVTGSDGSTGSISGELFGPAGIELGLALASEGNGEQVAGTISGVKR